MSACSRCRAKSLPIAHHADLFPAPIEIRPHIRAALAAGPPQLPSVSVIQSRAQPSYARIEPGRKVLTPESPIITFELTDKLAKVRGHIWLYAKEALQTFPYLSANGLIVFCVNDAHVCTLMRGTARAVSTVWQLASASVPHSILSPIGLDRVRQKNAGTNKRDDGHY